MVRPRTKKANDYQCVRITSLFTIREATALNLAAQRLRISKSALIGGAVRRALADFGMDILPDGKPIA